MKQKGSAYQRSKDSTPRGIAALNWAAFSLSHTLTVTAASVFPGTDKPKKPSEAKL